MAIQFDASSGSNNTTSSSISFSHTCTGNRRLLIAAVFVRDAASNPVTAITYNSVAMTKIEDNVVGTQTFQLYGLYAPSTGSNTLAVTLSATHNALAVAACSYIGVKQGEVYDVKNEYTAASGTSKTLSVTTTVNACWTLFAIQSTGGAGSAGANSFQRKTQSVVGIYDSNGDRGVAGSKSMTVSSLSGEQNGVIISMAPAIVTGAFIVDG